MYNKRVGNRGTRANGTDLSKNRTFVCIMPRCAIFDGGRELSDYVNQLFTRVNNWGGTCLRLRGVFAAFPRGFSFFQAGALVGIDGTAAAQDFAREDEADGHQTEGQR